MKKIISLMALYFALVLPVAEANYLDDDDCSAMPTLGLDFTSDLLKTDCKLENGSDGEAKYCNCLKTSNNILLKAVADNAKNDLATEQNKLKVKYQEKLNKVLFQLNQGVHLQQLNFGIKRPDGQTDCTPKKFSEYFTSSICREKDGRGCDEDSSIKVGEYAGQESNLDTCGKNNDCASLYNKISEDWDVKKNKNKSSAVATARQGLCGTMGSCMATAALANTDRVTEPGENGLSNTWVITPAQPAPAIPPDQTTGSGFINLVIGKKTLDECKLSSAQEKYLKDMLSFFRKHNGLASKSTTDVLENVRRQNQICGLEDGFNEALGEYKFKLSYSPDSTNVAKAIPSGDQANIITALEKESKKGEKILKKGFEENTEPNACVSYDKYKVLSSVPDSSLIIQWSTLSDKQIADSLDPKVLTKNSSPSLQFIRNNPLLAKMVVNAGARGQLAEKLKKFAGLNQGKNKADQLTGFIDFMKKDASSISNGLADLNQCDMLARNAAAVYSSNLFPGKIPFNNDGAYGMRSNLYACAMLDQKNNHNMTLDGILESNALFDLLGSSEGGSVVNPNKDDNYKKYLTENCKGFKEFKKDYIGKYCKMFMMGNKCEEKFSRVMKNRSKRLLKKYYEEQNPEMGQLSSILASSTQNVDFDDMDELALDENQNSQLAQEYDEKIKPYTYNSSIYDLNQGQSGKSGFVSEEIAKAQAAYDKRVLSSSTGRGTNLNELGSNDALPKMGNLDENDSITNIRKTSNLPENVSNPGQVVPNYLSNNQAQYAAPQIDSKNITSVKQASEILDKLSSKESVSLRPEKKEEIVKDVQKYIDGAKDNNAEMVKLQDKISDLEDQISEDRKNKKSDRAPASVASGSATPVLPPMMPQFNQNFAGSVPYAPGFSPAGVGGKIQRAQSASAASYQKALNDKYIQSEKEATPYNRSTDQFVLKKEPYVGSNGGELLVGLELSPSKEEFSKIVTSEDNLKKYLNENLTKLPGSKIISIKCGLQCGPSSNDLILHIERDQFNKIVIRSVASSTPVARVHKLDTLSKEFKAIK